MSWHAPEPPQSDALFPLEGDHAGHEAVRQQLAAEARARFTDPTTSHAAARSLSEDDLRGSQRAVLACLRVYGPGSDSTISGRYAARREAHGWPRQSPSGLRTRRKELADAGLIVDTGDRVTLPSGRRSIVWGAK